MQLLQNFGDEIEKKTVPFPLLCAIIAKDICFERNENPMAKKSAMSKGYRKTIKKKPFLTKKEIIELIVILAVIVLAVILFNLFYDDGFIKESKLQGGEVVSYASTDLRDRYYKVADIGEIEGFTLAERGEDESPISAYIFTPDAETDHIDSISVNGSFINNATLVDTTLGYMASLTENAAVSEIQETEIQGHNALVYTYSYSEYDATYGEAAETAVEDVAEEDAEPAHNKFTQVVSAYIAADDDHTLCFHIYRKGGDESFYMAEDALVDYVNQYATAFTMVPAEG